MEHITVTDSIWYVGVDDTTIDLFESQYIVPKGVSYNSYVILDDKIAIMDTVDYRAVKEWMEKVKTALEGKEPDYLIVSHMEPDHSGSVRILAETYPEMKLVGNAKTFAMMTQFFDMDLEGRKVVVKEGDTLSLGSHSLQFFMAPMVHWPEVMVTYEASQKVLFSADGFGTFGALAVSGIEDWVSEARRYYFNIVGKYGVQVQALLKKASGLDIQIICPLHGPVLKENLGYYLGLYDTWSSYRPEEKGTVVVYASIHGNTAKAAKRFVEILKEKGEEKVELFDLSRCDMAKAVEAAFQFDKLVLAAATYDGGVFPPMEDFLHHLRAKAYQNRKIALVENGSWGPVAAKAMKGMLEGMKNLSFCEKTVTIRSAMKAGDEMNLEALAAELLT